MPARKRAASSKETQPADKRARKSTGESESTLISRPKRQSVGTPQYNFTRPRRNTDRGATAQEVTGAEPTPNPPKRRGRPPKQTTAKTAPSSTTVVGPARPRGRPKSVATQDQPATKRSIGSIKKDGTAARPRGRPPKVANPDAATQPAKRGAKSTAKRLASNSTVEKSTQTEAALKGTKPQVRRGRPVRKKPKHPFVSISNTVPKEVPGADGLDVEATGEEQSDYQYWLMKAEPNDRYENGVNVKFSIDDLAAAEAPEPWDGVRNYGARNNMRAMRRGDLAFFYHSNCQVPGIVGVMRIVQEHTPDKSAFDPKHPYYDPKSAPSNPKWDCVHVEFVKKFDPQITLKMMQENKNGSGELADMQLLKMGRLSVSAVSPKEWRYILSIVNEDAHLGENHAGDDDANGYESDTDGETLPNVNGNANRATGKVEAEAVETGTEPAHSKTLRSESELVEEAGE